MRRHFCAVCESQRGDPYKLDFWVYSNSKMSYSIESGSICLSTLEHEFSCSGKMYRYVSSLNAYKRAKLFKNLINDQKLAFLSIFGGVKSHNGT